MANLDQPPQYKVVRGLSRGLDLLRAFNSIEDGCATSSELSNKTGLHRATVRRLLETLISDGFVRKSTSNDAYQLTVKVRQLSEGFTGTDWIAATAAPILMELLQKVAWPSELTIPNGDSMQIRETTHRLSSLSFHQATIGRRMPMLLTASGRAYFSYCGEQEREDILRIIRTNDDEQACLARDPCYVKNLISRVRSDGFAMNSGEWNAEKKIGSIAMPIVCEGKVLACLNVVYLARAFSTEEAVKRFAAPLRDAVSRIADSIRDTENLLKAAKR